MVKKSDKIVDTVGTINIFDLVNGEISQTETKTKPKFETDEFSGYRIMVRFRNKQDYYAFADLINQPGLKVYNKIAVRKTIFTTATIDNTLEFE